MRRSQVGWSHQSGVSRTTRRSIHESTQLGTYVDKQGSTRGSPIGETPGSTILEISQQQYGAGTQGGLLPTRQQQPPTPRPPTQQQYDGSGALWEKCAAAAGTASGTQRQHARATTPEIAQQVFVPYQQQQQRQQVGNKEDEEELQQPHHKGLGAPEVTHGVWASGQQQHRQPDSSLIGPDPSPFLIPEHERSHKFPKKHWSKVLSFWGETQILSSQTCLHTPFLHLVHTQTLFNRDTATLLLLHFWYFHMIHCLIDSEEL